MHSKPRLISFYLPQFHPIPENDRWWGKGFTEWTNAAKAKPLFPGHEQPHLPADLGFYDLRVSETREQQANLARASGIEGFCYYHYWFAGRRLLERVFDEVLASGKPDFPFCLCWANATWTGIWHGEPKRVLIEQTYPGDEDFRRHFDSLLPAFRDPRYMKVDGKPLFLVYQPHDLPDARHFASYWRRLATAAGLRGLYLVGFNHDIDWHPVAAGFDASILQKMPPLNGHIPWSMPHLKLRTWWRRERLTIHDYAEVMHKTLRTERADCVEFPCVMPNWDNTPRSRFNGLVLRNSRPELFRKLLSRALRKCEHYPAEERLVFLKAWNEWAEGNYLEPDRDFGLAYLEAVRGALDEYGEVPAQSGAGSEVSMALAQQTAETP